MPTENSSALILRKADGFVFRGISRPEARRIAYVDKLVNVGDQNGSKNEQTAPKTSMGYFHEGPSVGPLEDDPSRIRDTNPQSSRFPDLS